MVSVTKSAVSLFVDRTAHRWIVRDPDGHEVELYVDLPAPPGPRTRQMAATPAASAATAAPNAGR